MRMNLNKGIYILAIVAVAVTSSCQKENLPEGTFSATMERHNNHNSKVTFNGTTFNWTQGDTARAARKSVLGDSYSSGFYQATVVSNNVATLTYLSGTEVTNGTNYEGNFYAYLPASIYNEKSANTNRVTLPSSYSTDGNGNLIGTPMYAESTDKYLEFKNLCGMMCLKLATPDVNTYVTKIKITTDKKIQGTFDVTFNDAVPTITPYPSDQPVDDAEKSIVLNTLTNIIDDGHIFFIPLPEGEYRTLIIKMFTADGKVCTKTMNNTSSLHIVRSRYTVVDLTDITLNFEGAIGAKGGYFSVSETTKVQFSQGNLQYRAKKQGSDSINTWRFAPYQYSHFFTETLSTNSAVQNYYNVNSREWVDLFGWGTSGANGLYPYTLNPVNSIYGYPATRLCDWGANCAIINGGNQPDLWRTLTRSEWDYIFNQRGSCSWTRATVCNTSGIILLPDGWTCPTNISTLSFSSNVAYIDNSIDETQWLLLEASGCIFLPVTGVLNYNQQQVWTIGQILKGFYWSFSTNGSDNAYRLKFDENNPIDCCSSSARRNGNAVRLVRDVSMAEWQQNN